MKKKLPLLLKEIKSKQLPTIDYATQKSISYSQLSMFNECPKKWSLQYKEGYKQFTSSIHTVFGWQAATTSICYLVAMQIQGMVMLNNPSYVFDFSDKNEYPNDVFAIVTSDVTVLNKS